MRVPGAHILVNNWHFLSVFFSLAILVSQKERPFLLSLHLGLPLSPGPPASNHGLQFSQTWVFKLPFPLAPVVQPWSRSCRHCLCKLPSSPCAMENSRLSASHRRHAGRRYLFYSASIHFSLPVLGTVGSYGEQDHWPCPREVYKQTGKRDINKQMLT